MVGRKCKDRFVFNSSQEDRVFLTFDVDWANDDVIAFTLDLIEGLEINATFFITHETEMLKRMRDNPRIELGIHPNFNPLLDGDFQYGKNIDEVISHFMKIVPEAVSVRSHSMTQSSQILDRFIRFKLKYDCNHYIPYQANIELRTWHFWNPELMQVPFFWEDDVHFSTTLGEVGLEWNPKRLFERKGLKIFNFHPIHVYLNTIDLSHYECSREFQDQPDVIRKFQNLDENAGVRAFLLNLISETKARRKRFGLIREL